MSFTKRFSLMLMLVSLIIIKFTIPYEIKLADLSAEFAAHRVVLRAINRNRDKSPGLRRHLETLEDSNRPSGF